MKYKSLEVDDEKIKVTEVTGNIWLKCMFFLSCLEQKGSQWIRVNYRL